MCCIRVKFELLNYGWIVGYIYIVMNIGLWAQVAVLIIDYYIGPFGTGFMQVLYLGRAPRIKETLPDFREKCQVARHSRVFRGLTGSQQTPRIGVSHVRCPRGISRLHAPEVHSRSSSCSGLGRD